MNSSCGHCFSVTLLLVLHFVDDPDFWAVEDMLDVLPEKPKILLQGGSPVPHQGQSGTLDREGGLRGSEMKAPSPLRVKSRNHIGDAIRKSPRLKAGMRQTNEPFSSMQSGGECHFYEGLLHCRP